MGHTTEPKERRESLLKQKVEIFRVWPEGLKLTEPWGNITTEEQTKLKMSRSPDGMQIIIRDPVTEVVIVCALNDLIRAMAQACEQQGKMTGNKLQ